MFNIFKCECCCNDGGGHDGECGQRKSTKGCDKYGTTLKYTKGSTLTCNTDNQTNPDLAVYLYEFTVLSLWYQNLIKENLCKPLCSWDRFIAICKFVFFYYI